MYIYSFQLYYDASVAVKMFGILREIIWRFMTGNKNCGFL